MNVYLKDLSHMTKKIIFTFFLLAFTLSINGQSYRTRNPIINDEVINKINTLYLSEKYRECIDSCKHYLGYEYHLFAYENHPYRYWNNKKFFFVNDIESIATILYLGCISAYQYSLKDFDTHSIFDGIEWARACVAIYDDYLHDEIPNEFSSIEAWANYIQYAERAMFATQCGDHLLAVDRDDSWLKKQGRWFKKKSDKISDALYKNIIGKDSIFSNYPILQYKVYTISSSHILKKGNIKAFQVVFKKRVEAFKNLIQICHQNNIYNFEIPLALNSLKSMLCTTVIENEFCKKAGGDYERFCMENLIELQDISYSLNGSNRYSQSPSYSLRDIQNCLKETDCAILHFEAPVASGHLYFQYDLSTRYRNYALIITRNQDRPEVWHRGYINDSKVNDLDKIKEEHPNVKRYFYVGTPRMSFIDIAGIDSSIVRLHSLSQLLQEQKKETTDKEITFIGDLNYKKIGEVTSTSNYKGGPVFNDLIGPAKELMRIKELFTNVRPICGDDAKRNVVANEISRNNGVVHISTHGELFSSDYEYKPEDLILKKNIMENSRLILSGYNDAPNSPMSYLSGGDVLKLKKINSSIVFLDACLSGKGAVGASGSVGLAEAFHLIGAKNVICYLESVKDDVATDFSNRFYLELSKGKTCHDAFFIAKKSINQNIKVVLWE